MKILHCIFLISVSLLAYSFYLYLPKQQAKARSLRNGQSAVDVDIVLTSWYLTQPDAQYAEKTHIVPSNTFHYMRNFYQSAKFLKLHVIIFHDSLPQDFVKKYQTSRIHFKKTDGPPDDISPQDWRFFQYHKYLQDYRFRSILFADLSDVFFFHNPFYYMQRSEKALFIQRDVGTLNTNLWSRVKFKYCFNITDLPNTPLYSDGLWAGKVPHVNALLDCFVKHLEKKQPFQNCNMMAFNLCLLEPRFKAVMEDPTSMTNPYLKECGNDFYAAIHNKCIKLDPNGNWNDKWVDVVHGSVVLKDGPRRKSRSLKFTTYY